MNTKVLLLLILLFPLNSMLLAKEEPKSTKTIQFYNSGSTLPKGLPFSEMVRVGNIIYLAGQLGVTPGTLKLVPGGMEAEAKQTMENIKITLEAHHYSMSDIVKCTVMLADISEWGAFNKIYATYFTPPYPARSAMGANGLGLGARVEVECIAAVEPK